MPACEEILSFAKRLHTRSYYDRTTRPIRTLCLPIPAPDPGTSFSLKPFRFPYRKVPADRGNGSMQEEVNGKLNYLGEYFVGLVLGQRPVRNRALFVGAIPRVDD